MNTVLKSRFVCAAIAGGVFMLLSDEPTVVAQDEQKPAPALVCTLSTPELQQRREGIMKRLRESAQETRELDAGWSIRYSSDRVDELVEFVKLERKCCSFLEFSLRFEPNAGPVWLSITGPAGAKTMIAAEMKPLLQSKPEGERAEK